MARQGKRAAEILQRGLAQLFFCFVFSFPLWLCSCARFSLWYSVLSAERPKSSKTDRPSLHARWVCSPALPALSGGPFWPLSGPNPSKRTSPALPRIVTSVFLYPHRHGNLITRELAVGLCPFLSLVPVLSAERPKSSKTDLASSVCLAVVRFGRSAAQILQNGPRHLGLLGCAPCPPSGGPFRPLSSPNPSKRTSPAWSAWLLLALRLVVRLSLASLVCLAVLLALPLVVCLGRSAAQILQNGPRQLGLLGCSLLSVWWSV